MVTKRQPRGQLTSQTWSGSRERGELRPIAHQTAPIQPAGLELEDHERLAWNGELARKASGIARHKSKARIVIRVADQDDHGIAFMPAGIQSRLDQLAADPLALQRRLHRHRAETRDPDLLVPLDVYRCEQDVTDDT